MADPVLRPARPDEATALSDLALRSKAHWGYSDEFLEACRAELTVHVDEIEREQVVVAELDGTVVGFSMFVGEPPEGEVYMLFVEPGHIGSGVGAVLFTAVREHAVASGYTRLVIDADHNAVGFYERQGAVQIGESPSSSIPGRTLPNLELDLTRSQR